MSIKIGNNFFKELNNSFSKIHMMDEKIRENFITEFPKEGFGIIEELQGRMHFAILDQIKMMQASGMQKEKIHKTILANVEQIIINYDEKLQKT